MYNFAHIELPAIDLARESRFYSDLFHWKFDKFYGDDYLMIATGDGEIIGGLTKVHKIAFQQEFVNYVEVDDIDRVVKQAEKLGGTLVKEKGELPSGFGYFANLGTPDGYCIGIWQRAAGGQ